MAYSEGILEAAIGMATINSLLEIDEVRSKKEARWHKKNWSEWPER